MAATFLLLFFLVEWLEVPVLTEPLPWLSGGGVAAAAIGFALLVGDVLLPVPASLVMIAHGALFGFWAGSLLSLAGGLGASCFAFLLGRIGGRWVVRIVAEEERRRVHALLERSGDLLVLVTRPVPILAETVAVLAGTSPMSWPRLVAASLLGTLPAALIYALAGATSAALETGGLVFGLVLAIAASIWWWRRRAAILRPPLGDAG